MSDEATRSTDLDALLSRASAVNNKLLSDPFLVHFLPSTHKRTPPARPPLINIGTHARTYAIDHLLHQFLSAPASHSQGKQVVSLGAGSDTRYWRFRADCERDGKDWKSTCQKWVELDFPEATSSKSRAILTHKPLSTLLGGSHTLLPGGTGITSPDYALLPVDLRSTTTLSDVLFFPTSSPILDRTLPTLLLAECVLIYLPPETVSNIFDWFMTSFGSQDGGGGAFVGYDPFGLQDSFGRVMLSNLASRNLSLPSAETTPTLESLSGRLKGFEIADSLTLRAIRDRFIPLDEYARVAKIEMIDEVEELNLVLEHYAITFGVLHPSITGDNPEGVEKEKLSLGFALR